MPPKRRKAPTKGFPPQVATIDKHDAASQEREMQLQREITWCIEKLAESLEKCTARPGSRAAEQKVMDTARFLKVLQSKDTPLVKKRAAMRQAFGDYRQKMVEDEKKLAIVAKQFNMTDVSLTKQNKSAVVYNKATKTEVTESGSSGAASLDFRFGFSCDANDTSNTTELCDEMEKCVVSNTNEQSSGAENSQPQKYVMKKSTEDFKFNFQLET